MTLVDSSVWIDYFRGEKNAHTTQLDLLLEQAEEEVGVADLALNPGDSLAFVFADNGNVKFPE